jgi:hypothetical protein
MLNQRPYVCFKCGDTGKLSPIKYEFRFRPLMGYVGMFVGLTYEIVRSGEILFCQSCTQSYKRSKFTGPMAAFFGVVLCLLFFTMAFYYPEYFAYFGIASVITFIGGFFVYNRIAASAGPKVAKHNRRQLVLDIPRYGLLQFDEDEAAAH